MPPQAAIIKPGRPAPTIGPGTAATAVTARPMASRETPPSGREAAWAGFAELVELPTPKVPFKGWLGALSNSSMCHSSFRAHSQQPPLPPFVGVSLRKEQCRLQPSPRPRLLP